MESGTSVVLSPRRSSFPVFLLLLSAFPAAPTPAQVTWDRPTLENRAEHDLAYDAGRGRLVLFGGRGGCGMVLSDTWEWDGKDWLRMTPSTYPGYGPMVYDSWRKCVVLFDGNNGRTWTWDGKAWIRKNPPNSPSPRPWTDMVFDGRRGRVVLFGGYNPANAQGYEDTWEWDGKNWIRVAVSDAPPPRWGHCMAYDSRRSRTVLFGGWTHSLLISSGKGFTDTWEYDGKRWVQSRPAASPPYQKDYAMAFDGGRNRTVLSGKETWEWDGTSWTRVKPATIPTIESCAAMAYCPMNGGIIQFGGYSVQRPLPFAKYTDHSSETWLWDGGNWTLLHPATCPALGYCAMAYDRRRRCTVLFGNDQLPAPQTWERAGGHWHRVNVTGGPNARRHAAMVFDEGRRSILLFGGISCNSVMFPPVLNDLWEWDGTRWTWVPTSGSPPPARYEHAMAYDNRRGESLLFGGSTSNCNTTLLGDTWSLQGTKWTCRQPATRPPARRDPAMAYDPVRERVVLFGGHDLKTPLNDTWEWDGKSWIRMKPAHSPPPRYGHGMVYDQVRDRILLFGGIGSTSTGYSETWEWDGKDWLQLKQVGPLPLFHNGMFPITYDIHRGRTILYGGTPFVASTWECHSLHPAGFSTYGPGCTGSQGIPELVQPLGGGAWLGEKTHLELTRLSGNNLAFLLVGTSDTRFGPLPLPFDLHPLGMPGCRLQTNIVVQFNTQVSNGSAAYKLAIPRSAGLLGHHLFCQGLAMDPPANPAGLVLSNAAKVTIGVR